jgi:hypothetical protein
VYDKSKVNVFDRDYLPIEIFDFLDVPENVPRLPQNKERDEALNLLGRTVVFLIECRPKFQRCVLEAARTSETSVDIQLRARQYIQEDSELHIHRRENLKSHKKEMLPSTSFLTCKMTFLLPLWYLWLICPC